VPRDIFISLVRSPPRSSQIGQQVMEENENRG